MHLPDSWGKSSASLININTYLTAAPILVPLLERIRKILSLRRRHKLAGSASGHQLGWPLTHEAGGRAVRCHLCQVGSSGKPRLSGMVTLGAHRGSKMMYSTKAFDQTCSFLLLRCVSHLYSHSSLYFTLCTILLYFTITLNSLNWQVYFPVCFVFNCHYIST